VRYAAVTGNETNNEVPATKRISVARRREKGKGAAEMAEFERRWELLMMSQVGKLNPRKTHRPVFSAEGPPLFRRDALSA